MANYEIFWSDLTEEAKDRLIDIFHENIVLSPIAIIEIDDKYEDECPECDLPRNECECIDKKEV